MEVSAVTLPRFDKFGTELETKIVQFEISGEVSPEDRLVLKARKLLERAGISGELLESFDSAVASNSLVRGD